MNGNQNPFDINAVKLQYGSVLERSIGLFFQAIIPVILLLSGIIILYLRYSGWSILIGFPLITFGTVFSIYTYNDIAEKNIIPIRREIVKCRICGKITPKIPGLAPEKTMCSVCFKDNREKIINSLALKI